MLWVFTNKLPRSFSSLHSTNITHTQVHIAAPFKLFPKLNLLLSLFLQTLYPQQQQQQQQQLSNQFLNVSLGMSGVCLTDPCPHKLELQNLVQFYQEALFDGTPSFVNSS
jgi:hypothetical protein